MEKDYLLEHGKNVRSEGGVKGTKSMFWEEIKSDNYYTLLLPVFFILRRTVSIIVVVYYKKQAMFQIFPLIIMSMMYMMYMLDRVRFIKVDQYY
jgi:hypothetical protein